MTYEQAKKDFMICGVFVPVKDRDGKIKYEEVNLHIENIPDDTEGRVGAYNMNEGYPYPVAPRLCFIAKEELKK